LRGLVPVLAFLSVGLSAGLLVGLLVSLLGWRRFNCFSRIGTCFSAWRHFGCCRQIIELQLY